MQVFACERARALSMLGIAIAASKPTMPTTIITSIKVNAACECNGLFM